jgi:hypothetical protein
VSCAAAFGYGDVNDMTFDMVRVCPDLAAAVANYTATSCASSFDDICNAAYTDNPPFSCTVALHPDFLTTLGKSAIKLQLRSVHPI